MVARTAAVAPSGHAGSISPFFFLFCGLVLMLGAGLVYWFEQDETRTPPPEVTVSSDSAARALQRARQREEQARAELARQAAEEAAERSRRAQLLADGAQEAEARKQREELARRQAAAAEARRVAAETEAAWQRFYKPSTTCADASAATRVECVNEYIKARREFQSTQPGRSN